jgi:hypothetical protein
LIADRRSSFAALLAVLLIPVLAVVSAGKIEAQKTPPYDESKLLKREELFSIYRRYDKVCSVSTLTVAGQEADKVATLAVVFPKDVAIPDEGPESMEFFRQAILPVATDSCAAMEPTLVILVLYFEGGSKAGEISFTRAGSKWSAVLQVRPVYRTFAALEAQEDAEARSSAESAAQRAESQARLRKIADRIKSGDLVGGMGEMLRPAMDSADAFDEATVEKSGVFFSYSPDVMDKTQARIVLCNKAPQPMRMATAIELNPRAKSFDTSLKSELVVRGWGHLAPGQCKVLRTGGASSVFALIQIKRSNGKWDFASYPVDGRFEDFTLDVLNRRLENRFLSVRNLKFCINFGKDFTYRSTNADEVVKSCGEGYPFSFPVFIQYKGDIIYTLSF